MRRSALPLDDIGRGHDANIGHLVQTDPLACGRIDQHLLDRGEAVAPLGRRPNLHVVGPSTQENVADLLARHQSGRCASHISWLQPITQRLSGFLRHLYVGHVNVDVLLDFVDPLDRDQGLPHDFRLVAQDRQIVTEDAHDDRLARPCQNFLDPLAQVGFDTTKEARITVDHFLDRGNRLVVVDVGIDADPVLAVGDTDNLVRQECLADVRTEIANSGDRAQFAADALGDAQHFRMGCARIGDPVNQEIPLFERWQERIAQ
jgi:hypothetical protein